MTRHEEYLASVAAVRKAERVARLNPSVANIAEVQRLSAASAAAFELCRRPTGIGNRP